MEQPRVKCVATVVIIHGPSTGLDVLTISLKAKI